jgi:hypothetical protein
VERSTSQHEHEPNGSNSEFKRIGERPERERRTYYPNHAHKRHPYHPHGDRVIIITGPPLGDQFRVRLTGRQAVDRICEAWLQNDPNLLVWLLGQANDKIRIKQDGILSEKITTQEFLDRTVDAMDTLETEEFVLRITERRWNKIIAEGQHVYRLPDGTLEQRDVSFTLKANIFHPWVITEIGYSTIPRLIAAHVFDPCLTSALTLQQATFCLDFTRPGCFLRSSAAFSTCAMPMRAMLFATNSER